LARLFKFARVTNFVCLILVELAILVARIDMDKAWSQKNLKLLVRQFDSVSILEAVEKRSVVLDLQWQVIYISALICKKCYIYIT
jgi:hypothetical protein